MPRHPFPADFVWGVATSAYQIEGATSADGRGECIWDRFATKPGAISDRSDGTFACEHYLRWREDVALMRSLGVKAYRFSIAWPRVLPTGSGAPNARGLDFYDALVDGLLAAGIRPFVTLNHWDLPQPLEDRGGWPARATMQAFLDYADVVSRRLGDRVHDWITHNEPWCMAILGYETGEHAPGRKAPAEALRAAHHLLLSHGLAIPIVRANSPGAQVGIVLNLVSPYPASPSEADLAATQRFDGKFNRWYLDPLYRASYPVDAIDALVAEGTLAGPELPFVQPGDLAAIATPTDFLGINYYSRGIIRSDRVLEAENAPRTIPEPTAAQKTDMGWEVYPDGLRTLLLRVQRDYAPPRLYITENGAAYSTAPDAQGRVADRERLDYLHGHLSAVRAAVDEGAAVAGYFAWSLLDNFEWQFGYSRRFGIVWVDFTTQERIVKESGRWYGAAIASNCLPSVTLPMESGVR
jgi:beta-glucosidase